MEAHPALRAVPDAQLGLELESTRVLALRARDLCRRIGDGAQLAVPPSVACAGAVVAAAMRRAVQRAEQVAHGAIPRAGPARGAEATGGGLPEGPTNAPEAACAGARR
eukprot:CAMPEP_0181198610 /NCGR_PEP_ID=MMETSP1096-20121128/16718_1 /TAXON_ID=156174 ORGANISM="Chrysochromulina ericina, Strain CCMP281" /NCGR_SAMPLE_ID=MMETSP1096 /ASSEMBLY_ACC=CAM_ASM_000453 /LENGTH=107 /DNA_ID=CAMNT_0023288703 /DNA_START=516 /DNA_END=835 /DNA_ORIENTATION=-